MHNLIYLDTSSNKSHMMIMNEHEILSIISNENQANHGQLIHKNIQQLIDNAYLKMSEIHGICVLNGPGSYTGLRISLSTAKGLCYACDIPLILINKLNLMTYVAGKQLKEGIICAVLKARENEYFGSFYSINGNINLEPKLYERNDLLQKIDLYQAEIWSNEETLSIDFDHFKLLNIPPSDISELCYSFFKDQNFADLVNSVPFYLKNVHINKINKL